MAKTKRPILKAVLIVLAVIVVLILLSALIWFLGLDGFMSKYQKPVSAITFPQTMDINGKTYTLITTHDYVTSSGANVGAFNFARKLDYEPSGAGDTIWGLTGIQEYKSFFYRGSNPRDEFGGTVARTRAPSTTLAGYTAVKLIAQNTLSSANDPSANTGDMQQIVYDGGASIGDGGDRLSAFVKGKECHFVTSRYSNMYVSTYSYESDDVAQQAAKAAINQIDSAA